ncbi:YgiW/YdeI family stress tolerance OB fold protein [Oceanobacter mangrovi]|uniref:YgiW/YdeI family stress tolerance OB fold protein n=1 Tax=Oceanobacter mangrovi TaxID=2862510 RepID=UPI001C8D21BF|nr:NirD/YgiW/YdeI family stress tolerance protein [Oceanobacter mangrovi]
MKPVQRIALSIAALFGLGALSSETLADYQGPDKATMTNLQTIIDNPKDDMPVRLSGYLVEKVGNETYLFSDGSHRIQAEIDAEDFPMQSFDEHTLIEITGELDKEWNRDPEIDVDQVSIVNQGS